MKNCQIVFLLRHILTSSDYVNRVLLREVAQAVKGSNDTRFYGVGSGDVGKELPRNKSVVCVLLLGERSHLHNRELSQHACSFRG